MRNLKLLFRLAAFLGLCLTLVRCSSIDWMDLIKLDDITYYSDFRSDSVNEGEISPYAKITHKLAGNVRNPSYRLKNGDAGLLEPGTTVYSFAGYSTGFRLAAKREQRWFIYESDTNPRAVRGSDLLDIGGRVEYISVSSHVDGPKLASINDPDLVEALVHMVLVAPVDQASEGKGADQYSLEFHLKDGTTTARSYWLDTGFLSRGIKLPQDFSSIIRDALRNTDDVSRPP